ncbi:hypothetical protein PENSPDRAFT_663789 [Peniophora sp. CONT]|nr:hypothetical protein PENSPDRAFT_663789 [Peniophora sp. CONT]
MFGLNKLVGKGGKKPVQQGGSGMSDLDPPSDGTPSLSNVQWTPSVGDKRPASLNASSTPRAAKQAKNASTIRRSRRLTMLPSALEYLQNFLKGKPFIQPLGAAELGQVKKWLAQKMEDCDIRAPHEPVLTDVVELFVERHESMNSALEESERRRIAADQLVKDLNVALIEQAETSLQAENGHVRTIASLKTTISKRNESISQLQQQLKNSESAHAGSKTLLETFEKAREDEVSLMRQRLEDETSALQGRLSTSQTAHQDAVRETAVLRSQLAELQGALAISERSREESQATLRDDRARVAAYCQSLDATLRLSVSTAASIANVGQPPAPGN